MDVTNPRLLSEVACKTVATDRVSHQEDSSCKSSHRLPAQDHIAHMSSNTEPHQEWISQNIQMHNVHCKWS